MTLGELRRVLAVLPKTHDDAPVLGALTLDGGSYGVEIIGIELQRGPSAIWLHLTMTDGPPSDLPVKKGQS